MKACTKKQRQWLWFAMLWCGGIFATVMLSYIVRWVITAA